MLRSNGTCEVIMSGVGRPLFDTYTRVDLRRLEVDCVHLILISLVDAVHCAYQSAVFIREPLTPTAICSSCYVVPLPLQRINQLDFVGDHLSLLTSDSIPQTNPKRDKVTPWYICTKIRRRKAFFSSSFSHFRQTMPSFVYTT